MLLYLNHYSIFFPDVTFLLYNYKDVKPNCPFISKVKSSSEQRQTFMANWLIKGGLMVTGP